MTTTTQKRTMFDALIGEPLELALSQPHQILLSTGSVALMGSFASSSGIVDPFVGYLIAIGVEWAYLRGLASDSRAQTRWGGILNWSAFGIVVLWGVLWCAQRFGVFVETEGGWWLAAAHVVPVAWLSLCSAQCHRAAIGEEKKHEGRLQTERENITLELERKQGELALWEQAQEAKARLKAAGMMPKINGTVPLATGKTALCCKCQKQVAWGTPSEAGTIKRWGCAECRNTQA
jgi:hypothetical protein